MLKPSKALKLINPIDVYTALLRYRKREARKEAMFDATLIVISATMVGLYFARYGA